MNFNEICDNLRKIMRYCNDGLCWCIVQHQEPDFTGLDTYPHGNGNGIRMYNRGIDYGDATISRGTNITLELVSRKSIDEKNKIDGHLILGDCWPQSEIIAVTYKNQLRSFAPLFENENGLDGWIWTLEVVLNSLPPDNFYYYCRDAKAMVNLAKDLYWSNPEARDKPKNKPDKRLYWLRNV